MAEDNLNNASQLSPHSARQRYAGTGHKVGSIIGGVCAVGYAISPMNPNRGNFLSLSQDLILFAIFFLLTLLFTGIGYLIGKVVDGKGFGGKSDAAQ